MQNNKRIGNMDTNNPLLYKLGNDVIGRLNLGGGGAGATGRGTANELAQSQNNLNLPKADGISNTFRSTMGVDKSMDNFKSGFSSKFAGSGLNFGSLSSVSGQASAGGGAVSQPAVGGGLSLGLGALQGNSQLGKGGAQSTTGNPLDSLVRKSNLLSTPSSKGNQMDDEQ